MSSTGYTPVFGSIYMGTLFGRWPAAAVWASLLPLMNKRGEIDMSIDAICGMTGWPRDLLLEGVRQLMEPDPHSRTPGHDGVRLVPLVPDRSWGWRAVNFAHYREKARLMAKDTERAASGRDAERKRAARNRSLSAPDNPRCPPESPDLPLSDADADKESQNTRSAGDSPSDSPATLWREGLKIILAWRKKLAGGREAPVFRDIETARRWLGSLLTTDRWYERANGHDYPIAPERRDAKLLALIEAAVGKDNPKAYVAACVRSITGLARPPGI